MADALYTIPGKLMFKDYSSSGDARQITARFRLRTSSRAPLRNVRVAPPSQGRFTLEGRQQIASLPPGPGLSLTVHFVPPAAWEGLRVENFQVRRSCSCWCSGWWWC